MKKYLIVFGELNIYHFPVALLLEFTVYIMEGIFINFILLLILSKKGKHEEYD